MTRQKWCIVQRKWDVYPTICEYWAGLCECAAQNNPLVSSLELLTPTSFIVCHKWRRIMFREMRRFKQLLPQEAAVDILNRNTSGVLALTGDDNYPYAVPISYVYNDGKLYFHSAKSGHKIDAIKNHEKVSFCVIDQDQIVPKEYTTYYRSVIAFGKAHLVEDMDEMRRFATALAMKYSADFKDGISKAIDSSIKNMAIIEMTIDHITAKEAIELVNEKKRIGICLSSFL